MENPEGRRVVESLEGKVILPVQVYDIALICLYSPDRSGPKGSKNSIPVSSGRRQHAIREKFWRGKYGRNRFAARGTDVLPISFVKSQSIIIESQTFGFRKVQPL